METNTAKALKELQEALNKVEGLFLGNNSDEFNELIQSKYPFSESFEIQSSLVKKWVEHITKGIGDGTRWIDEGCEGKPKTYNNKEVVLALIKTILRDDEMMTESDDLKKLKSVDEVPDDRLLEIGANHYSIYEL